jgi:Family of unknown function (DUF6152)
MRELATLVIHLVWTVLRLCAPGGVRSVDQLLILNRSRERAPNLRSADRLIAGLCATMTRPTRLLRTAIVLKPSTIMSFHRALVKQKYRLLFTPKQRGKPGPKGPSPELIDAILEMKRRNPRFGYRAGFDARSAGALGCAVPPRHGRASECLQQQLSGCADGRLRADRQRDGPRDADHPARWPRRAGGYPTVARYLAIEGGTPNTLFRKGINDETLPPGVEVIVDGYRSRDGSNRASGRDITFTDGRKLFLGGSAPPAEIGE